MSDAFKVESRKDWYAGNRQPTMEELAFGAFQRIADATELMAKNHAQLISDRDWYAKQYKHRGEQIDTLKRQVAALRGVVGRMKKARASLSPGQQEDPGK